MHVIIMLLDLFSPFLLVHSPGEQIAPLPGKLTSPVVLRNVVRLAGHYDAFARALKQGPPISSVFVGNL